MTSFFMLIRCDATKITSTPDLIALLRNTANFIEREGFKQGAFEDTTIRSDNQVSLNFYDREAVLRESVYHADDGSNRPSFFKRMLVRSS